MYGYAEPQSAAEMRSRYKDIRARIYPTPKPPKKPKPMPPFSVVEDVDVDKVTAFVREAAKRAGMGIREVLSQESLPHQVEKRNAIICATHEAFPDLTFTQLAKIFNRKSRNGISNIVRKWKADKTHEEAGVTPPKPRVRDIALDILANHPYTFDQLVGDSRTRSLVRVRQAVHCAVAEERGDLSHTRIGLILGRDHTTILHSLNRMDEAKKKGVAEQRTTEMGRTYWIESED